MLFLWVNLLIFFTLSLSSWNPMVLAFLLIGYSIVLGMLSWLMVSKWMMMAIILIFLGGMMIIFLYAVTLSPNLKFMLNFQKKNFFMVFPSLIMSACYSTNLLACLQFTEFSTTLFLPMKMNILLFLGMILLLVLFSVVKISQGFKGALSKKF